MATLRFPVRLLRVALGLCVLTSLAAPVAQAALLGDALPGLLSPSDSASSCDMYASQPFLRWGDQSQYVLMPGGTFEAGQQSWALSGGGRIVSVNEPFYVHSRTDRRSLFLPPGASATSPPMCFDFGDLKLRLFAISSSETYGSLRVTVIVRSLLGVLSVLDRGDVPPGTSWAPSPEFSLFCNNLGGLLATDTISVRVTAVGASWLIDDGYLDPWKST